MSGDKKIKVYIPCGGGLGDVIQVYLSDPHDHSEAMMVDRPNEFPTSINFSSLWFRRLEDFKKKNPDSSIIVKALCTNPSVSQLFEYHPCIDRTELLKSNPSKQESSEWWREDYDGYKYICNIEDGEMSYKKYKPSYPVIYLDYHERCHADIIIGSSKYIVMHPFAGCKHREVLGFNTYNDIADRFIDAGYRVIVVGSGHEKYPRETSNRFYNLLGYPVRTFIYLVLNSAGFVGTHSSMIMPSWWSKKQSVCIVPSTHDDQKTTWKEFIDSNNPTTWGFKQKFNKTLIVEQDHLSPMDIDDIVRWIDVPRA
jgi:hypothetical protein